MCSVDFELNQKLARLIDESRADSAPAPSPDARPTAPGTPAAAPVAPPGEPARDGSLDRTATVAPSPSPKLTASTIAPGQVLAGRYRIQRLLGRAPGAAAARHRRPDVLEQGDHVHQRHALRVGDEAVAAARAAHRIHHARAAERRLTVLPSDR